MAQDSEYTQIKNTTAAMGEDPAEALLALAVSMGPGGPGKYIEETERAGQSQLVHSDRLPTEILHTEGGDEAFLALGFTFGPPNEHDPMFRPATLPAGWKRQGTDHAMWSKLIDQHGRERVSIFYKAAFYDRSAHMSLTTRYGYLSSVLYEGGRPVLDDEWLTAELAREELEAIAQQRDKDAVEADGFAKARPTDSYWPMRATEHRTAAVKARALMCFVSGLS